MPATIRVRGTGRVSVKPDTAEISLELTSRDPDYGRAVDGADGMFDALQKALTGAGLDKEDIRTSSFNVYTEREGYTDPGGQWKERFKGYACSHRILIRFPLDTERLSLTIGAVAESLTDPQMNIRFTAEDKDAALEELLLDCAANARRRAEILCSASGRKLGELLNIDYRFDEAGLYSESDMNVELCAEEAERPMPAMGLKMAAAAGITPRDIRLADSAVFTWQIL